MDAGFFRVSRSAGIRGKVRGFSVRLGKMPKLGTGWPAKRGFGDLKDPGGRRRSPRAVEETGAPLRSLLLRDRPPYAAAVAGKWRREWARAVTRCPPGGACGPSAGPAAGSWGLVEPRGGSS